MNPSAALIRGSILLLFLQVAQCFKKGGFQPQRRVYTMTSNENYMPAEQWLKQGLASAMLAGFLGMQIAGPANAIISLPPVPMVKEMERAAVNQLLSEEELALQESGNFILPFYKEKDYDTTRIVTDNQLQDAKKRIQALQPYLDEIERYLFAEEYRYLGGFFGVFAEQEDALVALIDGLFPSASPADTSAREAMEYEARAMFLALEDLREAAKDRQEKKAKGSFVALAKAYDRFLKAGNLIAYADPLVSTEPLYTQYDILDIDEKTRPKPQDKVIFVRGPDKGRTGTLLTLDKAKKQATVKLDSLKELREAPADYVAKQLTTRK
mmetsp:Transcript_21747/g.37389  ORF Transcript_21747/g.37389 Transcript_21747/m.37389 type:complete len:325 (-) Transcript_21747:849-1823(-)